VTDSGGTGTVVDDDGLTWSWSVSRMPYFHERDAIKRERQEATDQARKDHDNVDAIRDLSTPEKSKSAMVKVGGWLFEVGGMTSKTLGKFAKALNFFNTGKEMKTQYDKIEQEEQTGKSSSQIGTLKKVMLGGLSSLGIVSEFLGLGGTGKDVVRDGCGAVTKTFDMYVSSTQMELADEND
jgi:hypothetical protein